MDASTSPHRRFRIVTLPCHLGLVGAVLLVVVSEGHAAKRDAKKAAKKLVDAIVNRNQPPKIVTRPSGTSPRRVALFPETYDWEEEKRVHQALEKLYQNATAEVWEELVRRGKDKRYCAVLLSVKNGDAYVYNMGRITSSLAYSHLVQMYQRHMPGKHRRGPKRKLDVGIEALHSWRRKRAGKPLYELQLEVGERALLDLSRRKDIPKDQNDQTREKIEAELATLRRTKRPELVTYSRFLPAYRKLGYSPGFAKHIREAVNAGSLKDFKIVK